MVAGVAPARDFDGLFKKLLEAHPREALQQLCGARLDGEALRRRGLNNVLEQTETGREIARRNFEQGHKQGLVLGMRTLLRATYGDLDDLDDLARRLTERDHDGSVARIVAGVTVTELRS